MADLRPNRSAYRTYHWLRSAIFLAVILLLSYFGIALYEPLNPLWFVIAFAIFAGLMFWSRSVRLRKERYTIGKDRIFVRTGGILSDRSIELVVANITNVELTLQMVEHRLFGTGRITIMSAGSGGATLRSVDDPRELYEDIIELMQRNGFSIKRSRILQRERPSTLGIVLDFISEGIGIGFVALWVLPIIGAVTAARTWAVAGLIAMIAAGLLAYASWMVVRFLDMKRRVYTVYDDAVAYEEGFLTEHHSIMPMENISDTETYQGLISQILGLYDVKISCQGAGQEVTFSHMEHGKEFAQTLDKIIGRKVAVKPSAAKKTVQRTGGSKYTASFKPSMKRIVLPYAALLLLPAAALFVGIIWPPMLFLAPFLLIIVLFIFGIAAIIGALIATVTSYDVKESSVVERMEFLSRKVKDFSTDKIVGVVIKEDFIDKLFETYTIEFWSIGATESITFNAIAKDEAMLRSVLQKLGVKDERLVYEATPRFTFLRMIDAHLLVSASITTVAIAAIAVSAAIPLALTVPALLLAAMIGIFMVRKRYYRHAHLRCFQSYTTYSSGWLFRREYFSFYDDIKGLKVTRYPFSGGVDIRFNIAGVRMVKRGKSEYLVSNGFSCPYMDPSPAIDTVLDAVPAKQLTAARPSLSNNLVLLVPLCVVVTGGAAVLHPIAGVAAAGASVIIVIIDVALVKARSYVIEENRIVVRRGIIYRSEESMGYSKIDALSTAQGALNKMLGNGNVHVFTAGTSGSVPDLSFNDTKDYLKAYEQLKKRY